MFKTRNSNFLFLIFFLKRKEFLKMKKFMSEIKTKAAQAAIAVSGVAANLTVKASDTFTPYSGMNATSIVDGVFKVIAYVGTFGGALYAGGAGPV